MDWQPIETAPKDGREFLAVWGRQGSVIQIVRWKATHGYFATKGSPLLGFAQNATAWHELPALPKEPTP